MSIKKYQCKSGKYAGMWHVRIYDSGRYFHIGRFKTEEEANGRIDRLRTET